MDIRNGSLGGFSGLGLSDREQDAGPEGNRALVVAASPINRIVIAHTLGKIYLKADAVAPHEALAALRASSPIVVIIDDNGADGALEPLLAELASRSKSSERGLPRIILIGRSQSTPRALDGTSVDAVVAWPFTPDTLQPVVERVVASIRAG